MWVSFLGFGVGEEEEEEEEEKGDGEEATRGGGGFEWRKRVGRLRREEERGMGVRGALLVV